MKIAKAHYWDDLSTQDLFQLQDLISETRLNQVFYPVPEMKPGMGFFGGWVNHDSHPLHPNHIQPIATPVTHGPGLLGLVHIDREPEREEQAERERQAEREQQSRRVSEHWKAIESNMVFQLLKADANFKKAHTVFKQKQSAKKGHDLYTHPFAEFRFLETVASTAGFFILTDGKAFNWPTPDKKAIGKALGHAWAILDTFDKNGVKLADNAKHYNLKALLSELADYLEVQHKSGRAAWGGKNRPYRVLIQTLANSLRRHFGEVSPEIVLSLAAMVDCPFSQRTIAAQLSR